ncbi:SOS response-associated peptidase [Propionibacteriaceae bacterium G1746]|uniref:SOS response-associated peptidase n=1 Tax=Aestuariimicrobium sp. G57 TaxID=3418485 RepID=UPI003C27C862
MCGRYAASRHQDQLVEIFEVDEVVEPGPTGPNQKPYTAPRWNIAPTDQVAAIVERAHKADDQTTSRDTIRKLVGLTWGLVPSWSKAPTGGAKLINARLETVAEKPSFRKAFTSRRCLIPADGYYEWYASPNAPKSARKQPFYIHPTGSGAPAGSAGIDTPLMVMAGLYEFWRDPARDKDDPLAWLTTCAIITTAATDDLGRIHDRMPVQVRPEHWDAWLDPTLADADAALGLVHVPDAGEMTAHAVSRLVSTVSNDGPELVEPMPAERVEGEES